MLVSIGIYRRQAKLFVGNSDGKEIQVCQPKIFTVWLISVMTVKNVVKI